MLSSTHTITRFCRTGIALLIVAGCASHPDKPAPSSLKNPDESLLRIADIARSAGDFNAAIPLYKQALDAGGDKYQAHYGLGDSFLHAGAIPTAEAEFQAAQDAAPSRLEPKLGLGRVALARKDPANALTIFLSAIESGAKTSEAYDDAGVAYDMLGRHHEAQKSYDLALQKDPLNRHARNNLGISLTLSGNYVAAVEVLKPFANDPGASPRNRQALALALGLQGDTVDARAVAKMDLDPTSIDNNINFYDETRRTLERNTPGAPPNLAGAPAPSAPIVQTEVAPVPQAGEVPADPAPPVPVPAPIPLQ
jgi:Flp pilus assembly protein TadD